MGNQIDRFTGSRQQNVRHQRELNRIAEAEARARARIMNRSNEIEAGMDAIVNVYNALESSPQDLPPALVNMTRRIADRSARTAERLANRR